MTLHGVLMAQPALWLDLPPTQCRRSVPLGHGQKFAEVFVEMPFVPMSPLIPGILSGCIPCGEPVSLYLSSMYCGHAPAGEVSRDPNEIKCIEFMRSRVRYQVHATKPHVV